MAFAQWISVTVKPVGFNMIINHVAGRSGQFYNYPYKLSTTTPRRLRGSIINNGESFIISACGKENYPEGTEAQFSISDNTDPKNPVYIGMYSWDCPWGKKENKTTYVHRMENDPIYKTDVSQGNLDSGAIGNVSITCYKTA